MLDQATEHEICVTIKRLVREQDLTVLAISHQSAWQAIADCVYRIKDARTVESGLPSGTVAGFRFEYRLDKIEIRMQKSPRNPRGLHPGDRITRLYGNGASTSVPRT